TSRARIAADRAQLRTERRDALRARRWARAGPDERKRARLRLRKRIARAADISGRARLFALFLPPAGGGHYLEPRRARRARAHSACTDPDARHRRRPSAHPR